MATLVSGKLIFELFDPWRLNFEGNVFGMMIDAVLWLLNAVKQVGTESFVYMYGQTRPSWPCLSMVLCAYGRNPFT